MTADGNLGKGPIPPPTRPHAGTEDHQAKFAEISARTPVDEEFRKAFLRSKLGVAQTHPNFDNAARDRAVADLLDRLGQEAAELVTQPRPGGVGEGFFYNPDFKTSWVRALRSAVTLCAQCRRAAMSIRGSTSPRPTDPGSALRHSFPMMVRIPRISGCSTGPRATPGRPMFLSHCWTII